MVKKPVQQGRRERRGEAYFEPYVESLSDPRTKLAGFFSIRRGGLTATEQPCYKFQQAKQGNGACSGFKR